MDNEHKMPTGFAFQLSMNEKAMENFARMTEDEKRQTIEAARSVNSKAQMQSLVDDIMRLG